MIYRSPPPTESAEKEDSNGSSSKASSSEVSPAKKVTRFERPSENAVNPLDEFCAKNAEIWSCQDRTSRTPRSVRETILKIAADRSEGRQRA